MKKEEPNPSVKLAAEEENISKIRDILFGNNISEIDKRFNKLEQQLYEVISSVKDEMQKKLHSFDDYFKNEITSILDQIKKEQENRTTAVNNLNKQVEKINQTISEFKDEMATSTRDMRTRMMDHYKENSESISKLEQELKKLLNKEVNQLTESKVDRKALAIMLSEMALKINETQE